MTHRIGITTKYHGPTNTMGARISAKRAEGCRKGERVFVHWDHELNSGDNHERAAKYLAAKMDFEGLEDMYSATDSGYVFFLKGSGDWTKRQAAMTEGI